MKSNMITIACFILWVSTSLFSQGLDTNAIIANSKVKFLAQETSNAFDEIDLCNWHNCNLHFQFLEIRGINKMVFFKLFFDSISIGDTSCLSNFFLDFKGEAVFAYDIPTNNIFFVSNDDVEDWGRFLSFFKSRVDRYALKHRKIFLHDVYIEDADMKILFKEVNNNVSQRRKFAFKRNFSKIYNWKE